MSSSSTATGKVVHYMYFGLRYYIIVALLVLVNIILLIAHLRTLPVANANANASSSSHTSDSRASVLGEQLLADTALQQVQQSQVYQHQQQQQQPLTYYTNDDEMIMGVANNNSDMESVGGDRDSHGCIPSAGYMWCEVLQKCVRPWETPCPSA